MADFVREANLDLVVSFGKQSAVISHDTAHHFTDKQAMHDFLLPIISQKIAEKQPPCVIGKRLSQPKNGNVDFRFMPFFGRFFLMLR
ncbi:UDP-MurNAc-pentapeptide synthetase [Actinobacillus pleuropneumoniae]|nr:UDP-MurNAc-pentapeptide synthetase [Actinobacillus pleuropneumoniae]